MRKKVKYQGGLTKLICQKQADWFKSRFRKQIKTKNPFQICKTEEIEYEIISLSGISSFEDQLLSIYSLVYYAGKPIKWTIYSDSSYTEEHKDFFKRTFPFVKVLDWDVYQHFKTNKLIRDYLRVCPMAKKLNIILGHPHRHQTMYLDSDIIFYNNISYYLKSPILLKGLWYAADTLGDVSVYFSKEQKSIYPLNAGLLILNQQFDYRDVFEYLEDLKGNYGYFSEQSSFEFAFRKQGGNILDPRQFVIDSSDQFDFSARYFPKDIAMRHYTSPVRHKMWQRGWEWHFSV